MLPVGFSNTKTINFNVNRRDSFIKLWIWRRKRSQYAAAIYQHAAIEVFSNKEKHQYVSFWNCHTDHACCQNSRIPHFHEEKKLDDALLSDSSSICYTLFLEAEKIRSTFYKIRNSLETNSRLMQIRHCPFTLDNSTVTIFLLKKGGLFKKTPPRTSFYSQVLKAISIFGFTTSGLNYLSATLFPVNDILDKITLLYSYMFSMTGLASIAETIEKLKELEMGPILEKYPVLQAAQDAGEVNMNTLNFVEGVKYHDASETVVHEIIKVSKYGFAIAMGAFTLSYLIDWSSSYSHADIERLAKNVQHLQQMEMLRHAYLPVRIAIASVLQNSAINLD